MMTDPNLRSFRLIMITFIVFAIPVGSIASCNALNQSGFCKQKLKWIPDDEKIALAITAIRDNDMSMSERLQVAKAFTSKDPECCRIYKPSELIGQVREIEEGFFERPSYIEVKGGNPRNVIVSSCADIWWPWDNVPLPPGAPIP